MISHIGDAVEGPLKLQRPLDPARHSLHNLNAIVRTVDASEIARSDRSRSRILSVYSPDLLDHFEHPRNSGTLESPDAVAQLENPVCGDVLALSARISDGRIAELRFKAKGCVPSMACGSALTTLASGRTLAEASAIKAEDVEALVGGLPAASGHASHLAMDALTLLLRKHRNAEK